jgi:WhiB family redox-sensing transcriptional regulator
MTITTDDALTFDDVGSALLEILQPDLDPELDWRARGQCAQVDPELFFPEKGGNSREAKRICAACPVREECLEDALGRSEQFGVWGGLTERERRMLLRARRPVAGAAADLFSRAS